MSVTRDGSSYAGQAVRAVAVQGAIDITKPVAGYYRHKLRSRGVIGGVRIWFGAPHDPVTGELLDRSPRWQAELDGEYVEFDDVWPECAKTAISERDYRELVARREWAKRNAPNSAFANPKRRYDPLSTAEPLPF